MSMKWGKLIANLNNATHTITGYWLEQGMADKDMRELSLAVREEGLRVLEAANIEVEPPEGEPSPIRILKMTEALRLPPDPSINPFAQPEDQRTYPSMLQDLQLGRKSHEAEFLNGEIIELGRRLGVPTPYNSALLELVNKMFTEGASPGIYTPAELHSLIQYEWANK
jgi:2-dehydropantoate 2-reductase